MSSRDECGIWQGAVLPYRGRILYIPTGQWNGAENSITTGRELARSHGGLPSHQTVSRTILPYRCSRPEPCQHSRAQPNSQVRHIRCCSNPASWVVLTSSFPGRGGYGRLGRSHPTRCTRGRPIPLRPLPSALPYTDKHIID